MGNKPPGPPQQKPPPQKPPPEEGGGQKPPPGGGGGEKPPPEEGSGGGGQYPPPEGGGGQYPPPGGGGGSGEEAPPPEGEVGDGVCGPCGTPNTDHSNPQPTGPSHPLNQLNKDEISKAVSLIKARARSEGIRGELIFASVSMKEPPKDQMLLFFAGGGGGKPPRKAWAVLSEAGVNSAYESVVNLDTSQVEQFIRLPPGTQPSFNADDPQIVQDIVRKDPAVIERANRAGVTNMEYLMCDVWSYGYNNTDVDREHRRLMDLYLYSRQYAGDNQYAHPLDFLVTVDMISKQVIDIVDLPVCPGNEPSSAERPLIPPQEPHNYDPRVLPKGYYRKDVKPLEIAQPKGPSFKIEGNKLSWQKWEMIIGFNFREGLTFHNVSMEDDGKKRSVLYRAAISEMVVPYGDPRVPYYRKSAFDLGEYGLGYNANSLSNGCDCLGEIRYMDAVFANSKGEPFVTKNAICIHEEDAGILQKHTEWRNGDVTIARSRKLVVSFLATVTNYDYLYYWQFFQDGTMECDIKATGLLSVHALGLNENCIDGNKYGIAMARRLNAPFHQHIFCARLDVMIDGVNNSVAVQEVVPLEAPAGSEENPFGNGFTRRYWYMEKSSESGTDTNADLVRSWVVKNESIENPYSKVPIGWKLIAAGFPRILCGPKSGIYQRAGFARHNVWVTAYREDELYASGKYINQAKGGDDGVPVWVARDDPVRNKDIVVWHTFGLTHVPRSEDFPLMPVEGAKFVFRPANFFLANPALDVPPPQRKKCT